VTDVVVVVVAEEDPAHVLRLHDREHVVEPVAVADGAGVDDNRLAAGDDQRVDVDADWGRTFAVDLADEVRVLRDFQGLIVVRGLDRGVDAVSGCGRHFRCPFVLSRSFRGTTTIYRRGIDRVPKWSLAPPARIAK
jgi:hypothetical protein